MGTPDILLQAVTGLRYERDLTSLTSGAQIGFMLSNLQNLLNGAPKFSVLGYGIGQRNSPNTNSAEHTAMKSVYQLTLAPVASALLSLTPAPGPITQAARMALMQGLTSNTASATFADTMVGPKGSKTE